MPKIRYMKAIGAKILEVDTIDRIAKAIVILSGETVCAKFVEIKGKAYDKFEQHYPISRCGG